MNLMIRKGVSSDEYQLFDEGVHLVTFKGPMSMPACSEFIRIIETLNSPPNARYVMDNYERLMNS